MTTSICAQHLSFSYGGPVILEDVSFEIQHGETVGVIGPNGGGKTTLLSLIMGFLKPTRGKLAVNEASIGWVPQHFQCDREFPISVLDVVLGGRLGTLPWHGSFSRKDRLIAHEMLDQVGMQGSAHKGFSELSGGQMQRVLIARALSSQPTLLLLDEPTSHIDPKTQKELHELLKTLEMTRVIVTHDFHEAIHCVDRVFCLEKTMTIYSPEQICEHFTLGLYHS